MSSFPSHHLIVRTFTPTESFNEFYSDHPYTSTRPFLQLTSSARASLFISPSVNPSIHLMFWMHFDVRCRDGWMHCPRPFTCASFPRGQYFFTAPNSLFRQMANFTHDEMHRSQGCRLTSSNQHKRKAVKMGNPRQRPHARPKPSGGQRPAGFRSHEDLTSKTHLRWERSEQRISDFAPTCKQLTWPPFRVLIGHEYMLFCEDPFKLLALFFF